MVQIRLLRKRAYFFFLTLEVDVQGLTGGNFLTSPIFQKDEVAKIEEVV